MQRGWYDERAVTERLTRMTAVSRPRRVPPWAALIVVVLVALALFWVGSLSPGASGCQVPRGDELVCR